MRHQELLVALQHLLDLRLSGFLLLILSTGIVWAGLKLTGQQFGDVMRRA